MTIVSAGGADVYVVVRRGALDQFGHVLEARTALAWLHPLRLVSEDETGPDWPGSDEIMLTLNVDGLDPPYFRVYWDDADSGEAFALPEQRVQPVAFVEQVEVTVAEIGDVINPADGTNMASIGLPAYGSTEREKLRIRVKDLAGAGTYCFEYIMSRRRLSGVK